MKFIMLTKKKGNCEIYINIDHIISVSYWNRQGVVTVIGDGEIAVNETVEKIMSMIYE